MATAEDHSRARTVMVSRQLAARGITDARVLDAMGRVPREAFVRPIDRDLAYADRPLPIGAGQTISQPFIVAEMAEALRIGPGDRVLEIGSGSGYAAAVMAELGGSVFTIERLPDLAALARANLTAAGYERVQVRANDGTRGWPEEAPFDAILVSAGAPSEPRTLMSQLKTGGRLIVPIGPEPSEQTLFRITRLGPDDYRREVLSHVRFVPLIGQEGWDLDQEA